MVKHSGSDKRLKTQVTYNDLTYTYDQSNTGEYETYPLQSGSGKYSVTVFENVKDSSYAKVFSDAVTVELESPYAPYLVPNQFVWYTSSTAAVAKSIELCANLTTDAEKVQVLYDFVGDTILYDYIKALTIQSGYRPDVDETLSTGMGICFDYASLLACMLRVQGIPTKLVMGDVEKAGQYHAWNEVYLDGYWQLKDPTFKQAGYTESDYVPEKYY